MLVLRCLSLSFAPFCSVGYPVSPLGTPSQTSPEVCLLSDSQFSQVDNEGSLSVKDTGEGLNEGRAQIAGSPGVLGPSQVSASLSP